jgi:hypothetical protein
MQVQSKQRMMLFLCLGLASCSDYISLELFYADPLVEAPTRSINLHLLQNSDCRDVLARPHRRGEHDTNFLVTHSFDYPLRNAFIPVEGLPAGEEITIDVEAYDQGLTAIGRNCTRFTADETDLLRLQLFSLPKCSEPPSAIDLTIAIDTSSTSLAFDPNLLQLEAIKSALLTPEIFSSWTLISFGKELKVVANQSRNVETLKIQLDELANNYGGGIRLYDGIVLAAQNIRALALCRRVPALFVLSLGPDSHSKLQWQNAKLALDAVSSDKSDDIYSVGVGLNQAGFAAFINIIPENSGSFGLTPHPSLLEQRLYEVRQELRALVPQN